MMNEWYTPEEYIEAVREVMGSIDLDPASSLLANQVVKATRYFTIGDDGLMQAWSGNVFCNPPYTQIRKGHSSIKAWVIKTVSLYEQGKIDQAILLIPNDTSTRWFEKLWPYPACFPSKRIKFNIPGKKREQPTFGTCFVYLGPNVEKFCEVFRKFGWVVKSVYPFERSCTNLELWAV